jgi:hypothetical protein
LIQTEPSQEQRLSPLPLHNTETVDASPAILPFQLNNPPTANDVTSKYFINSELAISALSATDTDGTQVIPFNFISQWNISLRGSSSNGRTSNNPQAALTFDPNGTFTGTTTFTFTATDNTEQ